MNVLFKPRVQILELHLVAKTIYNPAFHYNSNSNCLIPIILVQLLLSKYAIETWFNFPRHVYLP